MKRIIKTISALTMCLALSTVANAQLYPYQNSNLDAHQRALDLCSRLTLEEKALLMLDESPAIPRLGIKKFFWWSEALHGAANMGNVTVFPEPVAMASSFNPDLLFKAFSAASDEMRAQYHERISKGGEDQKFHSLSVWTPNVNIFRDPRWGRGQETYGEDPYLTSVMGTAVVRGLQGPESSKYRKLLACAKHFAIHSGPESTRHHVNIENISPRDLWETYMPAFKVLVQDAKVREVMCAYQRWDNEPCCGNNRLLQQILRDEWGFKYLVVSDCGAVSDIWQSHKTQPDAAHAASMATLAGTDVECGYNYAYKSIPEAVEKGLISEEEVNKHVVRLLEGRFELGEMDDADKVEWSKIPYSVMSSKENAQISLDMARQSIVLLQNNNNILPLNKKSNEKIAVLGPNADNDPMMWGNYNGTPNHTVSILSGIKSKYKNIEYIKGCDLTDLKIVKPFFDQCSFEGKKGLKGTFWSNINMEGEPVSTEFYNAPFAVTTAGMHVFAPNVPVEDFSAKYETTFVPEKSGEVVLNVESCGHFEVYVNGKQVQRHHTWRTTPTRTPLQVTKGEKYNIEIRYQFVKTWGANMKVNIGEEQPINYNETIAKLKGINKVIFVGGISPALEGEEMPVRIEGFAGGDRTSIELPKVQRDFIAALKKAGKQIIYVNCSGSAIALTPETKNCEAIVQAWYAGQEGGTAVADILFGDVNPSGKLPVTFYTDDSQLPDFEDYSMQNRTYRYFKDTPLFPFGYGLSYTTFNIGKAKIIKGTNGKDDIISIPVTNTGKREGTEIVQLYVKDPKDVEGPQLTLKGFQRISLKPGETAAVKLPLDDKVRELFDVNTNTVHPIDHSLILYYGNSSVKEKLQKAELKVKK